MRYSNGHEGFNACKRESAEHLSPDPHHGANSVARANPAKKVFDERSSNPECDGGDSHFDDQPAASSIAHTQLAVVQLDSAVGNCQADSKSP